MISKHFLWNFPPRNRRTRLTSIGGKKLGCLRWCSGQQPELFCPQRHAGSTFEGSNPSNQSESSPTKDHTRDDSARTGRCELEKSSETHLGGVFGRKKWMKGKGNGYAQPH